MKREQKNEFCKLDSSWLLRILGISSLRHHHPSGICPSIFLSFSRRFSLKLNRLLGHVSPGRKEQNLENRTRTCVCASSGLLIQAGHPPEVGGSVGGSGRQ